MKMKIANSRKHGSHGEKPVEIFESQERQALRALPQVPYEIETILIGSVRLDGYVRYLNKYYRVDTRLKGQSATMIGNGEKLSIYCAGRLLEVYDVIKDKFQRQSCKDHYKSSSETNLQNHAHYIKQAEAIGANVARMIQIILARGEGFVDTRVVWGILTLNKKYPDTLIDKACGSAIELGSISLRTLHALLRLAPKSKMDEIALFLGNAGTGKTHCAISIGMRAAELGHSIFCSSVKRLSSRLRLARERNNLDKLFKQILTSKLWILDDWGVVTMPRDVSEEVFDLFDRRKSNSAMILTSNRDVEEWPQVFSDPILANAAIDRMFEHANIVLFEGPSYRMKGRIILPDVDTGNNEE